MLEPGANGLLAAPDRSELLFADHGHRRIATMPLQSGATPTTLVARFNGERLNSPNDIARSPPPPPAAPHRRARLSWSGEWLIYIEFPNGITVSPDGGRIFIAESGPRSRIVWLPLTVGGGVAPGARLITLISNAAVIRANIAVSSRLQLLVQPEDDATEPRLQL